MPRSAHACWHARMHSHTHSQRCSQSREQRQSQYPHFQAGTAETRLQSCPGEEQNAEECGGGTVVVCKLVSDGRR